MLLVVAVVVAENEFEVSRVTAAMRLIDPAAACRALASMGPLQWLYRKPWLVIFFLIIRRLITTPDS